MITYKEKLERSRWNESIVAQRRMDLAEYEIDADESKRAERLYCKFCYYFGRHKIVGHGFTRRNCDHCDKIMTFSNTDTDRICHDCALDQKCCAKCISIEVDW